MPSIGGGRRKQVGNSILQQLFAIAGADGDSISSIELYNKAHGSQLPFLARLA
jgi:hypothetical protein